MKRLSIIIVVLFWPFVLSAQTSDQLPRTGNQYLTAGLVVAPGLMVDSAPPDAPWSEYSATQGLLVSVGLQHFVAAEFIMGVEVEMGPQWMGYHTANSVGAAKPDVAFAWQVSILGRWTPVEALSLGLGIQYYRASLEELPLQQASIDLRLGTYLWKDDRFGLLEFGYTLPFIQGVSFASDIVGDERPEVAAQDWYLHRFRISFVWGF